MLTFEQLQQANVSRVAKWHSLESWSPLEWAGAMCGESGEAANAAKKLKRLDMSILNNDGRDAQPTREKYAKTVGMEVADTIIYGCLLCASVGVDLEECVREAFNQKSIECGFPERI